MSLFPVFEIEDEIEDLEEQEEISYGRSFFFDWALGDFPLVGGQFIIRNGHEAWLDWCVKCARTQRFAHLVYSDDYGVDLEGAQRAPDRDSIETELEDELSEALLLDPRTARVYGFSWLWQADAAEISFVVEPTIGPSEEITVRHVGLV